MDKLQIFWLVASILMFVIEAVTVNLLTIWFAFGALGALIAALLGAKLWLQVVIFFVVTIITLIAVRPLAKKYFTTKHHEPTNADAVIGKICVVTEDIDNILAKGEVNCMGKMWSARSLKGENIEKGSKAKVHSIEGVKLIVEPLAE